MSKLRLLFTKEKQASYISHLDLMRTFQRVFARSGLYLKHSNGFHPHPVISIVLPLPVGQSSECELLDFETVEQNEGKGIAAKLNEGLPMGLHVVDCYEANRPIKDLAYLKAEMDFVYDAGASDEITERLKGLFSQNNLIIEKRTKHKNMAEVDIAAMIKEISLTRYEEGIRVSTVVLAQNPGLNPALLASAIERYLPADKPDFVRVRRKEIYDAQMDVFR